MVVLPEYTFDFEAVLDASLRGRATLLSDGALLGNTPWVTVENDVVTASMDESERPRSRWFRKPPRVPVGRAYTLPEVRRFLRPGDRIRIIRDITASDEIVVTRGEELQFAVGEIGSRLPIELPKDPDDSGYVTLAGRRLDEGQSRVVGDFEVSLLHCGRLGIPKRPLLLAQGRREIPRATLVAWAHGVREGRFAFPSK